VGLACESGERPRCSDSPIDAGATFGLRLRDGPEPGDRLFGLGGFAILDFSFIL
jgi:hypothetical protein